MGGTGRRRNPGRPGGGAFLLVAVCARHGDWTDPGPGESVSFDCPDCGGRPLADDGTACPACGGSGEFELSGPVGEAVPRWAWAVLETAELWEKGLAPEAGGQLDQPAALLAASRICWRYLRYWRIRWQLPWT